MFNLNERINYYFSEITKIPHGSYNEKALSDYIKNKAIAFGYDYYQDKMANIIVYKPASEGYENSEAVILQAHIDMVCAKKNNYNFDFEKDALNLKINKQLLYANNTTLGADDGAGVSYILSVLEDKSLHHPKLICVFTVQEEVGLFGAENLKKEQLMANKLINLDCGGGFKTYVCSAGGATVKVSISTKYKEDNNNCYKLEVNGLLGGHSGKMIHRYRANAIKLLARTLKELNLDDFRLNLIDSGSKDNAIPQYGQVIFTTSKDYALLKADIKAINASLIQEYSSTDPNITLELTTFSANETLSKKKSQKIIDYLYEIPNGLLRYDYNFEVSVASLNIGVIRSKAEITLLISVRSSLTSKQNDIINLLEQITTKYGFSMDIIGSYPSWPYDKHSELRKVMKDVAKELYDEEIKEIATHGGLECGVFKNKIKPLDVISFGPIINDCHTPSEALDLNSFHKMYKLLIKILERLK